MASDLGFALRDDADPFLCKVYKFVSDLLDNGDLDGSPSRYDAAVALGHIRAAIAAEDTDDGDEED